MNIVREGEHYIVTSTWFTPELCALHPEYLFVFGDNLARTGTGGQACIRHCNNVLGIATKREPTRYPTAYFYDDSASSLTMADREIIGREVIVMQSIFEMAKEEIPNIKLVFPVDGLGSGLSKMPELAPNLQKHLYRTINRVLESEVYKIE